jgi:hypothetical protein
MDQLYLWEGIPVSILHESQGDIGENVRRIV